MAAMAAIFYMFSGSFARAEMTEQEKQLESRVEYLEERLRLVEELLRKSPPSKVAPRTADAKHRAVAAPPKPHDISPPQTPDQSIAANLASAPPSIDHAEKPQSPSGSDTPPGVGEADDAPQELNVLRDNAVTLKPAGLEISEEVDYFRRESGLQNDRAVLSTTSIRYGVLDWLELSSTIPLVYSTRTSDTSPSTSATEHVSGFGDVVFQANARVVDQTTNWPGIVVSLGVITPTGPNPYNFGTYRLNTVPGFATPNPRNPLADYFSLGSWGVHTNLQFYETVDPIILFFGFGVDRIFPLTASGYTIDAFNRLTYNFGLSFALSEKTTLGFSVNGSYTPNLKVNGRDVYQSSTEPTLARFTVIQRIKKNVYLEPSVSSGLDQDSPDFVIGLGLRARF